ncbi:hypothetical protein C0993_010034 [Termitomyces sp. T159_Od127]|nr:hypothetical protein C0993_010034 [Termitomyces sp. T159_Od127]
MTIPETAQSTSRPPVSKPRPAPALELNASPTADQTTEVKKRSKRRRKDIGSIEETPHKALPKEEKKSKKRKRAEERPVDEHDPENEGSGAKVKKKVKHAEENLSDATIVPARKRKNKTGFPDPNEDASLSEQTKKCQSVSRSGTFRKT